MVPCDPVRYLNYEYGEGNWFEPKRSNYTWTNLDENYTLWSRDEWPHVIRFYKKNGTIDVKETEQYLNLHMKDLNLKALPPDNEFA